MAKLSPMMQQYLLLKESYKDCILMFRLGDFYEMFFEDAQTASKELELVLTGRDCGLEERAPMCGVPYHSVNNYIKKLVENGHKVAICEQMTDPATSKYAGARELPVYPICILEKAYLGLCLVRCLYRRVCCGSNQSGWNRAGIRAGRRAARPC